MPYQKTHFNLFIYDLYYKIIQNYCNTNNVFVVFAEEETAVNNYLKQYESLNFEYLSDITTKDLYTLNTPFTYVLNENKIIVDKKIIKNISSLDIS